MLWRRNFKRGGIGLLGPVRLSEVTSGESVGSPFRRVSVRCHRWQFCSRRVRLVEITAAFIMSDPALISALARSLLAGELTAESLTARAARTLGHSWRWLRPLSVRYVKAFSGGARPRHRDVVRFLLDDLGFKRALAAHRDKLAIAEWLTEPQHMQPCGAAERWDPPVIETAGDLAKWLSLHPAELEWFADLKGLCRKPDNPRLQHYRYRVRPKRSGGVRLIESPKPQLKEMQRRILTLILDRVPAHESAHGFVKGRSITTFAAPHVRRHIVLRMDLEDFFPAFPAARAQAIFRTLGYPEAVAALLGGVCSNAAPRSVWNDRPMEIGVEQWWHAQKLYARPHLPQGAPTSPALANITAFRLDCRLSGLARTAGAAYTRYADDLAFSGGGEFSRIAGRFAAHASAIALEEGFGVNHHKTRFMPRGVRQSFAGIVVNEGMNLRRSELEKLEATLINCARLGPESQNRHGVPDFRAHLSGRIAFAGMVNRPKGQRLRAIFDEIRF
jgi:RNA-directed DNA polymerase